MEEPLSALECVPCRGGEESMKGDSLERMAAELSSEWRIIEEHHLERQFKFKDFKEALDFVINVSRLAEQQGHHPDICFGWGKAKITLWTHKIKGLSKNDFIMAAKIDRI